MKPLFVLLGAFAASALAIQIFRGADFSLAGRIAMSVMLVFTASGHFLFVQGMTMMIPHFIPFKRQLVYFTGVVEIAAAIGLLIPRLQHLTAWLLILFFLLILPANIHAAIHKIDYQKATNEGAGRAYLWFRVPLQMVFILWVHFFALEGG